MKKLKKIICVTVCGFSILSGLFSNVEVVFSATGWSGWQDSKPSLSAEYEVEERTVYRYRDKLTKTSTESSLSGWTKDETGTTTTWGDWSAWQDEAVTSSTTRTVDTRKMYRYRDKSTTTSTQSSLSGWTRDDTKTVTTWPDDWSEWKDEVVTETATREVKTQSAVASYKTQYQYWGYTNHFCESCGGSYSESAWYDSPQASRSGWVWQRCVHGIRCDYSWYLGGKYYYWERTQTVPASYKTQYSYRDAIITYSYYKWSDWSTWSTSSATDSSTRETDSKTQYRYKDSTTTYTYYKWGDWSDWSETASVKSEVKDVESKVQYRYKAVGTSGTTGTTPTPAKTDDDYIKPLDPGTGVQPVSDDKITDKGNSQKKNKKDKLLYGKAGTYKVTNAKKKTLTYMGAGKKATSIVVPDTIKYKKKTYKVTAIASNAFSNNKKIKSLRIGNNVKKIGNKAFYGCKNLKTVVMGKNVTTIGDYAFYGCKKLERVDIYSKNLKKIGKAAFKKASKKLHFRVPKGKKKKYDKLLKNKRDKVKK